MKLTFKQYRSLAFAIAVTFSAHVITSAQSISGYIQDENNEPVPHANIFVRELKTGASCDENGKYYLALNPGYYHFVVSSIGYQTQSFDLVIGDKAVVKNIWLKSSSVELNEVVVRVKRRDPAYEIIQLAIQNKERYLSQIKSSRTKVYVRAGEVLEIRKKKDDEPRVEDLNDEDPPVDPFEEARKKEEARLQKINLTEMNLILNYQDPGRYKEERTAFKSYGSRTGLFIPLFSDADFNFYHNLVDLKGIAEIPLISPISRTAILSYKYRLEETLKEEGTVVYKIRVTPRKSGDATCRGYIYINDASWNINRLELSLHKGGLRFYDDFTIRQTYHEVGDSLWIPTRQEFDYQTKSGSKVFKGNTVLVYSDFENNFVFPPKFFGNEVAITTEEAYKKDSSYWNSIRPEPLTVDQQKMVAYRDSIEAAHKNKTYLDSIEARFNRVTIGEILYNDIGFRRDSTKRSIYFSSLLSTVGFEVVGGWRFGPGVRYFKQFENARWFFTSAHVNFGLKNSDVQGSYSFQTMYNPRKQGFLWFRTGRSFYSINSFDAYLNQLKASNYILHDFGSIFHRRELFNGFFVETNVDFSNRQSVAGYDATSVINEIIEEGEALKFEAYRAFITRARVSYTPAQRFMTEPNRKVILGSKYPTFSITHRKGWRGPFGSDVNFDYLEVAVEQNLLLGTLGNSKYTLLAGKFINSRGLPFIDLKRFRQSDPYLMSDPRYSFQLLDTAMSTTGVFLEGHYIHHFNGAMINNIPLVKKLRLQTVAGGGFMWVKENNYRHEELFAGVERIFKLGARRRLRLGVYGVLGQSNALAPRADWKVSFDIIDMWKREWSY